MLQLGMWTPRRSLARISSAAKLIVDRSHDASAGEIMGAQVKALDIDAVVMGVYGRNRLQELVLSGVSHDLVSDPPTSLLISH